MILKCPSSTKTFAACYVAGVVVCAVDDAEDRIRCDYCDDSPSAHNRIADLGVQGDRSRRLIDVSLASPSRPPVTASNLVYTCRQEERNKHPKERLHVRTQSSHRRHPRRIVGERTERVRCGTKQESRRERQWGDFWGSSSADYKRCAAEGDFVEVVAENRGAEQLRKLRTRRAPSAGCSQALSFLHVRCAFEL
ncbi:hypothetical protein MTO96_010870 [Rhipicephalus appendiculatus]